MHDSEKQDKMAKELLRLEKIVLSREDYMI